MGANFTPTFGAYSPLTPFRYWCQKVLPLVYDDSLSYYECLNKTVDYLNKTMEDVETLHEDTEAMLAAFNQLQTYVNTYFDELDLTAEVQTVLDRMAENGSLDELLRPLVGEQIGGVVAEQIDDAVAGQIYNTVAEQINEAIVDVLNGSTTVQDSVENWLNEHVATGDIVVDDSLSISGAAADASRVGGAIAQHFSVLEDYVVGDCVIYNGELYRFVFNHEAGAWTGTDATKIMLATEIAWIKNELQENGIIVPEYVNLTGWVTRAYINTNKSVGTVVDLTPVESNNYAYIITPVKTGELYKVSGSGGVNARLWAFVDADYKLVSKAQYTSGTHLENLIAPADGFLIVNTYTPSIDYYVAVLKYASQVVDDIKELENQKEDKGFYSLNDIFINNNSGFISIGNIDDTVDYTPVPSSSWYFGIFPVVEGDVFKITGSGGNASRLWCFVDTNDIILSKSAANLHADDLLLTAPEDGKLIINVSFQSFNVQRRAENGGTIYEQSIEKAKYNYKNDGLDILSAFSNVSCFGDSLTASVVYTRDNGDSTHQTRSAYKKYPWILGQKIGAEAESVARGGYTATDWWNEFSNRIVEKENQLIVIYLGTNGGLTDTVETDASGTDYTTYANTNTGNYCKIVAKSLSVGARVLLIKIHQGGGGDVFVTNDVIDKIAEKFTVATVDVPYLTDRKYHAFPDNSGTNTLHYNDLGYSAFADSLIKNVGYLPDNMAVRLIPV